MTITENPAEPTDLRRRGPYGLVGPMGRPMCDECDVEMHPYGALEGGYHVCGFGCDSCGWSFDTSRSPKEA